MAILQTKNLVKDYPTAQGPIRALDNLSVNIPKGATALLGPNGSGKSTLIRIILGLIPSTDGEFQLFDLGTDDQVMARNRMGYMPETPSIISKVNAVKFVRHFGMLSGLSYTQAMQRAHEVLDYVGLDESRYREVEKYSTGMKQRLLFAQSLVHDPDVIILDEPTTGLSPEGRVEMLDLIKEINVSYGKSVIFSTHILPDVEQICDYTVLIDKGKEVFQGNMEEIGKRYKETTILETSLPDKALDILSTNGFEVEIQGRLVAITSKDLITLESMNNLLAPSGISILSLKSRKPNLEDLFMSSITQDIDR